MIMEERVFTPIEEVNDILVTALNLFHADMVTRAVTDDSISKEQLIIGLYEIMLAESQDDDDFVPDVFKNV